MRRSSVRGCLRLVGVAVVMAMAIPTMVGASAGEDEAPAPEAAPAATDPTGVDRIERIDTLLNHASSMYWAGRARPYSSVEPERERLFLEEALSLLEREPDSPQVRRRVRRARQGIEQADIDLRLRARTLGGWSPWYGVLLDVDPVIVWSGNPVRIAAQRAVAALFDRDNLLRPLTDQVFAHVQEEIGDPAVAEAARAYLDANTNWYVIAPFEASNALSDEEIDGLEESPPRVDSMRGLMAGMSSDEIGLENLSMIRLVENDRLEGLHYLGVYHRSWELSGAGDDTLASAREWYADGFAQGPGYPKWVPILLLVLGGVTLPWIVRVLTRTGRMDPKGRLDHAPPPPAWVGLAALIAGYAFAWMGRQGLIVAAPDLQSLLTPASAGWILVISVVVLFLPMVLVYLTGSKINSIATRLGNQDMICLLLLGGWFGGQIMLLRFGAAITGLGATTLLLAAPALLGAVGILMIAKAVVDHAQTGRRWTLGTIIAGGFGLAVAGVLEVHGTTSASAAAALAAIGPVVGAATLDRWNQRQGIRIADGDVADEGTRSREVRDVALMLRAPTFIETKGVAEILRSLEGHVVGDEADDEAIEVVWIEGERGCGKTRIALELAGRIQDHMQSAGRVDEVTILFGDCNEPGDPEADIPYEPLRQAFAELMGVERFGNPAANAQKLQQGLEKVASAGSVAGAAISVALNVAGGDEASFNAANEGMMAEEMVEVLVRSVAPTTDLPGGRRVILVIDDVQWMDEDSLSLLRILLERLVDRFVAEDEAYRNRIAIVVTRRHDGDVDADSQARGDEVRAVFDTLVDRRVVNLMANADLASAMTTPTDSEQWLEEMFDQLGCTERARRALRRSMEANGLAHQLPLYRLEHLQLALDEGYLRLVEARCDLVPDTNLEDLRTGSQFDDMVKRELTGLDQRLVEILHCCSIIGRRFQVSLVARIFGIDVIDLLSLLAQAEQRGIIVDCLEADDIYEFRDKRIAGAFRAASGADPGKVQQMVREYHLRFVQVRQEELAKASLDPARLPFQDVMAMAYHTSMVAERIPGETIRWASLAADGCERQRLYGRALEKLAPAIALVLGRDDLLVPVEDRVEILLRYVGLLLDADGDLSEAEDVFAQVDREIAALPATERSGFEARRRLLEALVAYRLRRFGEVAGIVAGLDSNEAAEEWMRLRGRFLSIMSLDPRLDADRRLAELESLLRTVETSIETTATEGDPATVHHLRLLLSELLNALGSARLHVGKDPTAAREAFEAALGLNRDPEIADRKGEAIAFGGLGDVWAAVARAAADEATRAAPLEAAREAYEKNLAISRETGDQAGIMRMTSMLGGIKADEAETATDDADRARLAAEAGRLYEESTMLSVETRRSFPFRFGFAGLVRVERIAGTHGGLLESLLEEARSKGLLDQEVRSALLEHLRQPGGSEELRQTLASLAGILESESDLPSA